MNAQLTKVHYVIPADGTVVNNNIYKDEISKIQLNNVGTEDNKIAFVE